MAAVHSQSGQIESVNPSDWSDVVSVSEDTQLAGLHAAVKVCREASIPAEAAERADGLRALADRILSEQDSLADILTREIGKLRPEAQAEVKFSASIARHYADLLANGTNDHVARQRPVSLAGVITPFNFPCSISIMKTMAAFGAGSPVLWKPSPHAIGTAMLLHSLIVETLGAVVGIVISQTTGTFTEFARVVDALSYTGSSAGASTLWTAIADRPIPLQLELGSCNATIVGADFAVDEAARTLRTSVYSFAGQKCSNTRRILVHQEAATALFTQMANGVSAERVGDARQELTTLPPLVAPANAERFRASVAEWSAISSEFVVGRPPTPTNPCFVEPVIALAKADSPALRKEIFGPGAVLIPYRSFEEAIDLANATPYGLFAGLLTHDVDEMRAFETRINAGILKMNQPTPGLQTNYPSQGWGASGLGPSEMGSDPFRPYLRLQTVYPHDP